MTGDDGGVPADLLPDDELIRELESLYRTRIETLQHGSRDALDAHTQRTRDLESEFHRRRPGRAVDPRRTREGSRAAAGHPLDEAGQPTAEGRFGAPDPTDVVGPFAGGS